jgi:tagatose-1,6-bisphosphate aldolase non-catalytic subunit AgaZ/GatZ
MQRATEEISLAAAEARIEVLEAHVTYYQGMWKAQKAETKRYADLYMDRCEKWGKLREALSWALQRIDAVYVGTEGDKKAHDALHEEMAQCATSRR